VTAHEQQEPRGADPAAVMGFLRQALGRALPPAAVQWLDDAIGRAQG
jgi:hypothetical protein